MWREPEPRCRAHLRSWQETAPGAWIGGSVFAVFFAFPRLDSMPWGYGHRLAGAPWAALASRLSARLRQVTMVQARCSLQPRPKAAPLQVFEAMSLSMSLGPACCPSIAWTWSERHISTGLRGLRPPLASTGAACAFPEVLSSEWQLSAALELGGGAGAGATTFEAQAVTHKSARARAHAHGELGSILCLCLFICLPV